MLNYGSDNRYRNLEHCKSWFFFNSRINTGFASDTNLFWEVESKFPSFKQIERQHFELLNVRIWLDRSILLLKQLLQTFG